MGAGCICHCLGKTQRDRRYPWWLLSTGRKTGVTLLAVGGLIATIGAVMLIVHGPTRPLDVLVLVWVALMASAAIASGRWRHQHPDGVDDRR